MTFWEVDILGVDISGVDILGVDILRLTHAATIELSLRQKLAVTNEIRTLRRLHPLS